MHMKQQRSNSIWDSIGAQRDAVKAAKQPCFPVPYTLMMVHRPAAGGKKGVIPCVELTNIQGSHEIRRCEDILKPNPQEPIDQYLNRLFKELDRKNILGETIL
jgi:hypothetical protein